MKKIALLAVSTLFVVACSDDHTSTMGEKPTPSESTEFVATSTVAVPFVAGQNEADLSGCKIADDENEYGAKLVECPSTNGLTLEGAYAVNDKNMETAKEILLKEAAEIKPELAIINNDKSAQEFSEDDLQGVIVFCAQLTSDVPAEAVELHNNECADFGYALKGVEKAERIDTEIRSGKMMLDEAGSLAALADKKSEAQTQTIEQLNNKLALQKRLLQADRSDISAAEGVQKALDDIRNFETEVKDIENLRAESARLVKEGEYKIVNSTEIGSVEDYGLIINTEEMVKKEEAPLKAESSRDGYDVEPTLYDALPLEVAPVEAPEIVKPNAPKAGGLSDVTETASDSTDDNPNNGNGH